MGIWFDLCWVFVSLVLGIILGSRLGYSIGYRKGEYDCSIRIIRRLK